MKNTLKYLSAFALLAFTVSCKKEYDAPPIQTIPETDVITIDSLRNWQAAEGTVSFDQDLSVYGIITMDETDGNIYKNIFMQDHTGAINLRILNSGGLYVGDSVRIYLKGCVLSEFSGVLQLDSVDVDNNIVKQSTNVAFAPSPTPITSITTAKESELILLENVQFVSSELGSPFADSEGLQSINRTLEDCDGNTIIVRTSGYSSFADELLPEGNGNITCIVNHFNGEIQLLVRSFSEIQLNGERCAGQILAKNFDDGSITSGGWTVEQVTGTPSWYTDDAGGAPNDYGVISNYDGTTNIETESWLISPSVDLSGSSSPYLAFDNAYNYTGDALEVLISTDYVSGAPSTGSWTNLSPILSSGGWTWVNSTNLDLTAYIGTNVHIAFKYTGSSSSGSTWEIDNIVING
ncbi:MAG: DUF5689 domain-containing protein [Flavobacteriales bacterium]|nr:DUF5689 domain-containing protein [Flavobacteriales bacterium]